ncbi:MAG: 50S ribosomal protein L19 [Lentisphaerae bacterium]|nr:50S ribosomal protein L19 [Lentisphaerota bacterium]
MNAIINKIDKQNAKNNFPQFRVGDAVKVHAKIREGDKERIQVFSGTVIAMNGSGAKKSFTVRRISHGVGVEKVFPVYAPHTTRIEVQHSSHVRRAKLYYLRHLTGKKTRLREKTRK